MMTGTNTDAVAIENRRQIVWMNVAVREWNDAGAMVAWSVDGHASICVRRSMAIRASADSCSATRSIPSCSRLRDRGTQADRRFDVRRPTLELVGDLVPARVVVPDPLDHLATAMVGRHCLEQRRFRDQGAAGPSAPASCGRRTRKKSQSIACTSTRRCGAAWAPSTTVTRCGRAPTW